MASALWQNAYALSIRKGPLDLANRTASATSHNTTAEVASNTDDGVFTSNLDTNQYGGIAHFVSRNPATTTIGQVMGQKVKESATYLNFGMPVIGNPDFSIGQQFIETQIRDGWASPRIAPSTGVSSIMRGGQSPTCNFDFLVTDRALISASSLFFQHGARENTSSAGKKIFTFPTSSDGSSPLYYGCFLRKMSASDSDGRMLSDAIATELTLRASQSEPLTASMSLLGRVFVGDVNCADIGKGSPDVVPDFTLYNGRNYLLQNCVCTIFIPSEAKHIVVPIESFSLTARTNPSVSRYNTFFPLSFVMGDYSLEGSITIPAGGIGTYASSVNSVSFLDLLADAGVAETTDLVSSGISSMEIGFYWGVTGLNALSIGADATSAIPADCTSGVLALRANVMVTDVQLGGSTEATQTVSFRGFNYFDQSTGALARHAFQINWLDGNTTPTSWGFEGSGTFVTKQTTADYTTDL